MEKTKTAQQVIDSIFPEPATVTGLSGNDRYEYVIKSMHAFAAQYVRKAAEVALLKQGNYTYAGLYSQDGNITVDKQSILNLLNELKP